jgi:hypothetical protein
MPAMKNAAVDPRIESDTAAERGFVGGLLAAAIVILVNTLIGLLATGFTTGNYSLDITSKASFVVLVLGVLAIMIHFRRREHARAEQQYRETEAQIERAQAMLTELERELVRGRR